MKNAAFAETLLKLTEDIEDERLQEIALSEMLFGTKFKGVKSGRANVPIGIPKRISEFAGIPWGSTASIHSEDETIHRIVGPVQWKKEQWHVPFLPSLNPATGLPKYKREAAKERKRYGVEERVSA